MQKSKTKIHRINVNLTDGEYFTLLNLANFHKMTITDFVKKSCGILGVMPQTEFTPVWNDEEKQVELIDNTPVPVQRRDLTLNEYYELEEENRAVSEEAE